MTPQWSSETCPTAGPQQQRTVHRESCHFTTAAVRTCRVGHWKPVQGPLAPRMPGTQTCANAVGTGPSRAGDAFPTGQGFASSLRSRAAHTHIRKHDAHLTCHTGTWQDPVCPPGGRAVNTVREECHLSPHADGAGHAWELHGC